MLHLSEHAAYARIEAARAARRFSTILERLADGRLTLTTIGLLAPHLTDETSDALLEAAEHRSKRDVERLIAALHPQPDIPPSIRALPRPASAVSLLDGHRSNAIPSAHQSDRSIDAPAFPLLPAGPPGPSAVAPLAPRRYLLRVTISEETHRKLARARALLRHQIPDGDPAALIDRALTLLVANAERTKFAATTRGVSRRAAASPGASHRPAAPAKTSQHEAPPSTQRARRIPSAIRRAVWARDHGRCAFTAPAGRCGETGFLEFHHVVPFARGGAGTVENLELRCRAHNGYEAELAGLARQPAQATRSGPSHAGRLIEQLDNWITG